jgi:hypothetical protein
MAPIKAEEALQNIALTEECDEESGIAKILKSNGHVWIRTEYPVREKRGCALPPFLAMVLRNL